MQQICTRLNTLAFTWLGVALLVLSLTGVALGQAQTLKAKQAPEQKPVQGQQLCPAVPGQQPCQVQGQQLCPAGQVKGQQQCQVQIECPPIKPHGKTTCEATIDCPPAKGKKQP